MTRFIGDVHGKFKQYLEIIKDCKDSIQVGDFGAGFVPIPEIPAGHRFIRGNHDDPEICRNHLNWIKDVTVEGDMFLMGGAYSIDQDDRLIGVSWWPDEELSFRELHIAIDIYEKVKPRIVVSHDAPCGIMKEIFPWSTTSSRTSGALDTMFDIHQPELFIFGHWHQDINIMKNGTRFICLAELSFIDID